MSEVLYRLNQKKPHLLTLIIMSSFASMGAVIFMPALSKISDYFHITTNHSQLIITLFLVGYALGQLFYGPLANRLGRKRAFYVGIAIATFGSIVSILAEPLNSFPLLIFGRLLEALGSSAGLVISYAMINDYYYPTEARRVISFMTLAFAIMPGIATFVGSLLITYFSWLSCFYFMLFYGLTLIIPVCFLQETATTLDKNALHFKDIKEHDKHVLENRTFRHASFLLGLNTMCIYVFAGSVPLIAIRYLGIAPATYGIIGLIPFIGTALGSITSGHLSKRYSAETLAKASFAIEVLVSIAITIFFYLGLVNMTILMVCGFIFMFACCMMGANLASIASSIVDDKANGAAVMNFFSIGIAMCGTFVLALTPGSQIFKMPLLFLSAMALMLLVAWAHKRR